MTLAKILDDMGYDSSSDAIKRDAVGDAVSELGQNTEYVVIPYKDWSADELANEGFYKILTKRK